jgi:ABC-type glycerol-3-phosphate transport system permease component
MIMDAERRLVFARSLTTALLFSIVVFPVVVFVMLSFVSRVAVLEGVIGSTVFTLRHYQQLFDRVDVAKVLTDSLLIATISSLVAMSLGLFVAYFVSRGKGLLPNRLYSLALTLWFVPSVALSAQLYFWFQDIGLYDRAFGMILLYSVTNASLVVILLAPYLDATPRRMDEAAWMDGLRGSSVVWRVVAPAILPALEGVAILAFLMSWNELLYASLLSDRRVTTLPVAMLGLTTGSHIEWGQIAALGTLSLLPISAAILFINRNWVRSSSTTM